MGSNENVVLPDESEAYARKLMQVGGSLPAARVLASFHRLRHVECFGRHSASKPAIPQVPQTLTAASKGAACSFQSVGEDRCRRRFHDGIGTVRTMLVP